MLQLMHIRRSISHLINCFLGGGGMQRNLLNVDKKRDIYFSVCFLVEHCTSIK